MAVAQLVEATRDGSGLWFYECPVCPCDFGPMGAAEKAEREAAAHDAEYHALDSVAEHPLRKLPGLISG